MDGNPLSQGPDIDIAKPMMRTIWTLYSITVVVVLLRLYTQWRVTFSLGLGDAMMALSILFGAGILVMLTIQHHYGLGRHFSYLDNYQQIQALKFSFIGQPLGIMAAALGRNATCIMMLQLFGTTNERKYILWATFWQSLIVNIVTIILIFLQCKDVRTIWDPITHPSYCWRPLIQEYTGFVQGAINSATDLFLTILPLRIFYTLRMSIHMKIGLGCLLGLSFFAFIASIIKTVELRAIGDRADFTFGTVDFFTWVVVEFTLVDTAASVPLILPLFRRFRKTEPKNPTYHLRIPNSGHSIVILGGKSVHPIRNKIESKSAINDLETSIHVSGEENTLELEEIDGARVKMVEGKGNFRNEDESKWNNTQKPLPNPVHNGQVIFKHTTFDVTFKATDGEAMNPDGTRKRNELWLAKELPKIPWEAQIQNQ